MRMQRITQNKIANAKWTHFAWDAHCTHYIACGSEVQCSVTLIVHWKWWKFQLCTVPLMRVKLQQNLCIWNSVCNVYTRIKPANHLTNQSTNQSIKSNRCDQSSKYLYWYAVKSKIAKPNEDKLCARHTNTHTCTHTTSKSAGQTKFNFVKLIKIRWNVVACCLHFNI